MFKKKDFMVVLMSLSLLLIANTSRGTPPDWSVNPGDFIYELTITATVCEGTQRIVETGDILGAFVGDECRGVTTAQGTLFFLVVFSSAPDNEVVHFKFYDASLDLVRDAAETVQFVPDLILGMPSNPFVLHVAAVATISVLAPNGGEVWCTGSTQMIRWLSQGQIANVRIELSRTGFAGPWETLFLCVANDGAESFTVMGVGSATCVIRISDCANPTISDMSNGTFVITSDCGPGWAVDPGDYAYDGTITAAVYEGTQNIVSTGDLLGAFVGAECRGVTAPSGTLCYLMVYSNQSAGEVLTFKYYDASLHLIRDVTETLPFTPDMIVGTPSNPYVMHVTANAEASDSTDGHGMGIRVHPNPARDRVFVECRGADSGSREVDVLDAGGRRVWRFDATGIGDGRFPLVWDGRSARGERVPSGTYFIVLTSGRDREAVRFTLLR
jgi:hypothetical protein